MRPAAEVVGSGPAVDAAVAALEETTLSDGDPDPAASDDADESDGQTHADESDGQTHADESDGQTHADESDGQAESGDKESDTVAVAVERRDAPHFDDVQVSVVVGRVGDDVFDTASEASLATGTRWLAVELGGIGGYPITEASVAGFDPARECYACLRGRIGSNVDPEVAPVGVPDVATQRLAGALAARAAIDVLESEAGSGSDDAADGPLGAVTELPHRERRFLPLPGCDCADARDATARRGSDALDVEQALRMAERGLDERVGIVRQVGEVESFPAPYYLAELTDTSSFSDATAPRQAAGVATDWNEAFLKALGESYERYAAGVYRESDTIRAPAADLEAAVPPTAFVTPEAPDWSPDEAIEWVRARNLSTSGDVHVPADLVFHPPRNRQFRPAITTGLGLHTAPTRAILAGLYEIVERDAAVLAWYSTFEPLGLAVEDDRFATLAARARAEGLSVTTLLLTQDVDVPVVAVAVHGEEWPRFALGSAANLDADVAASAALEEAIQNWMELRSMGKRQSREASGAIGEFAEFPPAAEKLLDHDQTVPASSVGEKVPQSANVELQNVLDRVTAADTSVYATRTTTRDLEAMGFEAVRVLVPAAQPLFFENAYFGDRAESVPEELGFEPRLDRRHHPYP